jgi:hypothetical protein
MKTTKINLKDHGINIEGIESIEVGNIDSSTVEDMVIADVFVNIYTKTYSTVCSITEYITDGKTDRGPDSMTEIGENYDLFDLFGDYDDDVKTLIYNVLDEWIDSGLTEEEVSKAAEKVGLVLAGRDPYKRHSWELRTYKDEATYPYCHCITLKKAMEEIETYANKHQ